MIGVHVCTPWPPQPGLERFLIGGAHLFDDVALFSQNGLDRFGVHTFGKMCRDERVGDANFVVQILIDGLAHDKVLILPDH